MKINGAGADLVHVVLIRWNGEALTLELANTGREAEVVPIERRVLAGALRDLADAVEAGGD